MSRVRPSLLLFGRFLVVGTLVLATAVVALASHRAAEDTRSDEQRALGVRASDIVQDTMRVASARMADAAALLAPHTAPGDPRADEAFALLRDVMLADRALHGFGFALAFGEAERAGVERRLGRPLLDARSTGAPVPSRRHRRYVVPMRIAYQNGSTAGLGVNLAAEPARRATFDRAAARGVPQLSPPVRLIDGDEQAIMVYVPVPGRSTRHPAGGSGGFVIGAYTTAHLMATVRRAVGRDLPVLVVDGATVIGPAGGTRLRSPARFGVRVGGRTLTVLAGRRPTATQSTIGILVGGSLIALLVALLLSALTRRERDAHRASLRFAGERDSAVRRFASAFENAPIGMAVVSATGRWEQVNDALCRQLRCPADALVGRHVNEVVDPTQLHLVQDLRSALLAGREPRIDLDIHVGGTDDVPSRWLSVSATAVHEGHRVDHFIVQTEDVTERRAYETRLEHLASHDPLTGLLNRRALGVHLDLHVEQSRHEPRGALLLIDLDQFKLVNDLMGHGAGDELLKAVAERLRGRLRSDDLICRLGGDEFAVLLAGVQADTAVTIADELLELIRATAVPGAPTHRQVSASIGLAFFDSDPALTGETMMIRADLALYDAKDAGRDTVAVFAPGGDEDQRTQSRLTLVQHIGDALDTDGFVLHYQPIVDLRSGRVQALEALVRMRQPDGDLLGPATFLPLVERYGLAVRLDLWVLDRALDDLASFDEGLMLHVNVSGRSLGAPEFLDAFERRLQARPHLASRLVLELTETAAIADLGQAQRFARSAHRLGARLALDDFGVGFGSIHYLKHLSFDVLKIDGEFIRALVDDPMDRRIVGAVVDLARAAGARTVAEHVGSAEVELLVRELGVDMGQGYHLGRPRPLEDVWQAERDPGLPILEA